MLAQEMGGHRRMMMGGWRSLGMLAIAACGGAAAPMLPDAASGDAAGVVNPRCFGTHLVNVCLPAVPAQPQLLGEPMVIDTGALPSCAPTTDGAISCVIAATDLTIDTRIRAVGPRPLVLVASGSITITSRGVIDVGSHRDAPEDYGEIGAAGDPPVCPTFPSPRPELVLGGDGGSFAGAGGT